MIFSPFRFFEIPVVSELKSFCTNVIHQSIQEAFMTCTMKTQIAEMEVEISLLRDKLSEAQVREKKLLDLLKEMKPCCSSTFASTSISGGESSFGRFSNEKKKFQGM
eukprot:Sdes_comp20579_c0_seq1m15487